MAKSNPNKNSTKKTGLREINGKPDPTGFDKLIHERMRLGIISALAANESMSFNDLKTALGASDGNISVHARKLEDAGYLHCEKKFEGRKPLTLYSITKDGRAALERYIDHMDALIKAVKGGS
ncbi:MAG: transcriptional regulator [Pyrinomonadaceae bacterium]|nr:transcriptional regulator [Pyrinomonadaceae bacterium]